MYLKFIYQTTSRAYYPNNELSEPVLCRCNAHITLCKQIKFNCKLLKEMVDAKSTTFFDRLTFRLV